MSKADLIARSQTAEFHSAVEYRNWYKTQYQRWTVDERAWMSAVADHAERLMRRYQIPHQPLKFVKVDPAVENGWPHTLGDLIIWNSSIFDEPYQKQVELVIHEAVHVHQRANPDFWLSYLINCGYDPIPYRGYLQRNNPDIDDNVWLINGKYTGKYYRSPQPINLNDVWDDLDHPYEQTAYKIAAVPFKN